MILEFKEFLEGIIVIEEGRTRLFVIRIKDRQYTKFTGSSEYNRTKINIGADMYHTYLNDIVLKHGWSDETIDKNLLPNNLFEED